MIKQIDDMNLNIIFNIYGYKGYGFYYRLLELLDDKGYIDINEKASWHYFCSFMRLNQNKVVELIEFFCELDLIDLKLYKKKVIFCPLFFQAIENYCKKTRKKFYLVPLEEIYKKYKIKFDVEIPDNQINNYIKEKELNNIILYKNPIKNDRCKELIDLYGFDKIESKLDYMENWLNDPQKNKRYKQNKGNLFTTLKNWLKSDVDNSKINVDNYKNKDITNANLYK